ncbi:hypothetical protein, partial [Burkholderia cenocepacia]|uniref:hypothetical protein n=1 Tax=Burkholderia cenocepacia TaxID=95486 RepID=UPI002AB6CF5A
MRFKLILLICVPLSMSMHPTRERPAARKRLLFYLRQRGLHLEYASPRRTGDRQAPTRRAGATARIRCA